MRAATLRFAGILVAVMATAASAQKMPAHIFSGGGGKTTSGNGSVQHFSAVGVGMAVGTAQSDGVRAHHGFLGGARAFANNDLEPPEFVPPLENMVVAVGDDNCLAQVEIPEVGAEDNRDRNPSVRLLLVVNANQELEVTPGEEVGLPPGSYDVLAEAQDRRGNIRRGSFIIDVVDNTDPVVAAPVPNPTPVGQPAEAASPAGTPVAIAFTCRDNCDDDPDEGDLREVFPFGETRVNLVCTDASDNSSETPIVIRVADSQGPTVVGQLPAAFDVGCNGPDGATIDVPQIIWTDNGTLAADIRQRLVVDPGPGQQIFEELPEQLTLAVGEHILQYEASDASGNSSVEQLRVVITDTNVPRIEVDDLPASGWFGEDAAFSFRIFDDCGAPDVLQVAVDPPPPEGGLVREGNRISVRYDTDGRYALLITVTDEGGNSARDNSVSFGIDRTPPEPSIASPSQRGVDAENPLSFPFFGMGGSLGLSVGAEDEGDGLPSGIARVRVIADPGEFYEHVLADRSFDGAGSPVRGERSRQNIECDSDERVLNNRICNDGAISLRYIEPGTRTLRIEATDFAGNVGTTEAVFINGNLGAAMRRVGQQLNRIANPCLTCPVIPGIDVQAHIRPYQKLRDGAAMTDVSYVGAPYGTSIFLGGALKATESAMGDIMQLVDGAENANLRNIYVTMARTLATAAHSDLSLYNEWITSLDPARGLELFIRRNYQTDMQLVTENLGGMEDAIEAEQWSQATSNGIQAFFHQKMAHSMWVMDYHLQPMPLEEADGEVDENSLNYREYQRGQTLLISIRDELTSYLALNEKPAEDSMTNIRDRLSGVIQSLQVILDEGLVDGLSDSEYLDMLMELRAIARNSARAGNEGAYVRIYQYSIMQVVRWLTHFSLETAKIFDETLQPVYQFAQESVDVGVEMLDNREVQSVINLYGSTERALCPIIGVYHCWFVTDEQVLLDRVDNDEPLDDLDVPEECEDIGMVMPSQWANAPAGDFTPQCRIDLPE